ncbi:MAG: ABC-2 type transport system ATP-binding protein [Myxococcota bacterium]|jgi:ABC-2 type transport system ATP-binding protein
MIQLTDVTKSFYGNQVLKGLSLEVGPGELVGLIGPNGAGKSTALRIVTGQLMPDSGTASIGGADLQSDPLTARRFLGYVPQDGGVEPFLTGEEVLRFVAELRGVPADPLVDELLDRFALSAAKKRLAREYSEGMQRRLAFAAALIGDVRALILDESLNGLDPRGVRIVREAVEERRAAGTAVLLTGHFLATMERLCTRIALLHGGRIVQDLSRQELDGLEGQGRTLEDVFLEGTA